MSTNSFAEWCTERSNNKTTTKQQIVARPKNHLQNYKQFVEDPVSDLLDFCVNRNLPIAHFRQEVSAHGNEFTMKCRVASIERFGTCSTKKAAKYVAAKEMLSVLQNLPNFSVKDLSDNAFTKYYKLKEMKSEKPRLKLSERYMYFVKLNNDIQLIVGKILNEIGKTDQEKVNLICKALNYKYFDNFVRAHPKRNVHCVEIFCGDDYDLCFADTAPEVYTEIIDYFKVAFSFNSR